MKKYFVRAINLGDWAGFEKENTLYGDCVCIDWNCSNAHGHNQWSLFGIEVENELVKTESLDWVAIYLLGKNIDKFGEGISFLFLEESYFQKFDHDFDEDLYENLHICHYNINGVRYGHIKEIVKTTMRKIKDSVVSYTKSDLLEVLKKYIGIDSPDREDFDSKIFHLFGEKISTFYRHLDSSFFPNCEYSFKK